MMKFIKKYLYLLLVSFLFLTGCSDIDKTIENLSLNEQSSDVKNSIEIDNDKEVNEFSGKNDVFEDEIYSDVENVVLYIKKFDKLPSNYITKKDAKKIGWISKKGNLWEVAPKKSIGGDYFGNYEEKLPKNKNRKYYECDIDYKGGYRNEKRLIYSDDGLFYYTQDHYNNFNEIE